MRKFFLDRVQEESRPQRPVVHVPALRRHDRQRLPAHDALPVPDQGLLLNPNGDLHYCENSEKLGNVLDDAAEVLYFKAESLAHREHLKEKVCPTCLSPCQVNVGAMKQFVPYAKFLVRAYQVKHDPARHAATMPEPVGSGR